MDPDDPRAPPREVWDAMSREEQDRVVAALPSETEASEAAPPEGDQHFDAQAGSKLTLRRHFGKLGRAVYVACNLAVYYPGERMFSPDLLAVRDVSSDSRLSWVVAREGKGLDLALEILVAGDRRKDLEVNVERYARLGIHEYFVWDVQRGRLLGYRLEPGAGYRRIVPQAGRLPSEVLELGVSIGGDRLRFYQGDAEVPDVAGLAARLEGLLDDALARAELIEEAREQEARARIEAEQALAEAERGRAEAERRLAEALADLERLRGTRREPS